MTEKRSRAWNFEDMMGTLLINLMSRLVGALIRTIIILLGLAALCLLVALGIITYFFWITAPALIISCFGLGVSLIISSLVI